MEEVTPNIVLLAHLYIPPPLANKIRKKERKKKRKTITATQGSHNIKQK